MSTSSNIPATDPGWARLVQSLSTSLASLDKVTSSIRRTTKRVVATSDIAEAKAKVDGIVLKAGQTDIAEIHSVLQLVEKYVRLHASVRLEAARVVSTSRMTLDKFQISCDAFEQRCQTLERNAETMRANRDRRAAMHRSSDSDDDRNNESEELLAVQQQQKQKGPTQRERFEQELHEDALRDRSRDVREILDNVTDINEIFQHINQLVGEQGEQLDTVAVNVENAEEKTRRGVENLRDAAARQKRTRCTQLVAFFVVFVFIAVVLAVMTA